jgi:hypothetical protein
MVLVARLPNLTEVEQWPLPSGGAHGLDIDQRRGRIYVACDDGALVEVDIGVSQQSVVDCRSSGCNLFQSSDRACACGHW